MSEHDHIDTTLMDQRVLDLLNGGIDGELSSSEQLELNRLLAGSEQVRDLNDELVAITSLLDQVPEREPPQYLQSTIERQIRLAVQSRNHEEKPGFLGTWLTAHRLRTGIALAAGVVLTISVYEMGSEPMTAGDASNMVGTVVKGQTSLQGELLSSVYLDTDTLSGRVELRNIDNLFILDIQLNSDGPARLVVNFADRGLEFEGVTPEREFVDAISVVNGAINVASSGEKHFTLQLRRTSEMTQASPLELAFFTNDNLVDEARLRISKK